MFWLGPLWFPVAWPSLQPRNIPLPICLFSTYGINMSYHLVLQTLKHKYGNAKRDSVTYRMNDSCTHAYAYSHSQTRMHAHTCAHKLAHAHTNCNKTSLLSTVLVISERVSASMGSSATYPLELACGCLNIIIMA